MLDRVLNTPINNTMTPSKMFRYDHIRYVFTIAVCFKVFAKHFVGDQFPAVKLISNKASNVIFINIDSWNN